MLLRSVVYNNYVPFLLFPQFLRVLDELGLGLLTGPEASAVFLRFRACLGGREDVCYRAFCQCLEQFSEDLYQTAMLTWH